MQPANKQPSPPTPAWHDGGLDFELTDFKEARRVLDEESISQFDVAGAASPAQWKRLRRPSLPTDRALSGQAIDWLLSLPPDVRPERLGSQFPRIAHALAAVWGEPSDCRVALDKLLGSERKGRQGFPPLVQRELNALHDWMKGLRGWDQPF